CDTVDAQDADGAAAGIDDPRLRPGVLLRRRGSLPRGVYDAHLDVSELPDPGLPRPRPQAGRDGGLRTRAEAARPGDEPVLGDRAAPAAEEDVQGAHRRGSDPRGIPDHRPDHAAARRTVDD